MSLTRLTILPAVEHEFKLFTSDKSLLALPLRIEGQVLHSLPTVCVRDADSQSQSSLNLLDDVLSPTDSLYLLLRRMNSIYAITFVPYRAHGDERQLYLRHRQDVVEMLGEKHFHMSLICKEIGEITDVRSWSEREADVGNADEEHQDACEDTHPGRSEGAKDLGHIKNKCRLCDRRMKNKITAEALSALKKLEKEGDIIQLSLDAELVLALDLQTTSVQAEGVVKHLPRSHPTFTLYRHPNKLLYFIFHSPDSATVQQRMRHTMAIPGLVNVHAEGCGVRVDQKIEIHEPEDLNFEKDNKTGKFRSVYLRGGWQGTESQYDGLERDQKFYNVVG